MVRAFLNSQSCRSVETNPQARVIINSKNINRKNQSNRLIISIRLIIRGVWFDTNYDNKNAFVTKKLVEENSKIGFAYREKPDNETDSGWRFFTGNEEQESVDNPDNLLLYSIEDIIKLDDSIKSILNSEINTAFEKVDTEFKQVTDFDFGTNL